jgi:hypothetical protein
MYKGKLCSGNVPCVTQEEQGFGPSTLSTYPFPIYLRYPLRAQFISNLGPEWTRSYHTKEGFQVSERGIEKGARGIMYIVNLYMCI